MGRAKAFAIVLTIALAALVSVQFNPQSVYGFTGGRAYVTGVVTKPGQKVHFDILLNYTASQPVSSITYSLEVRTSRRVGLRRSTMEDRKSHR